MPQVAFRVGAEPVFTYTVLVYLGLLAAVFLLAREGLQRGWGRLLALEVLACALAPAALGGRVAYVLETWLVEPSQAGRWGQPWGDGLSLPGALVAGAIGLSLLSAWRRQSIWSLLGAAAPGLALAQTLGWLGAAAHGVHAGFALVPGQWWTPAMRDLYGQVLPRFPLPYLAAALSLGAWALITFRLRGDRERVACYCLLTGWGVFALLWAADRRAPVWAGLSAGQIGYLLIGVLGLFSALAALRRRLALSTAGGPA